MVNNIHRVRELISFNDEFDFYFVQILKRRKDNPDLKRDMVVITNFHIESFEQYDRLMPHIVSMCESENARAYFRINRRNYKDLSYHMLKRVVDVIASGMVKALKGTFDAVAGKSSDHAGKLRRTVFAFRYPFLTCIGEHRPQPLGVINAVEGAIAPQVICQDVGIPPAPREYFRYSHTRLHLEKNQCFVWVAVAVPGFFLGAARVDCCMQSRFVDCAISRLQAAGQ